MTYSAKFASAFYGPFRDAAESPRDVRVEATTGEVFTGSVDPNFDLRPSPGTCQCGDSSYDDLTVTLSL